MSGIILTSPTLSYVGAVDLYSASTGGNTLYNILFNSTLITEATVLMFEYKLQQLDQTASPTTIYLNYINTEQTSTPSGISNQWQISVPAVQYNNFDPTKDILIQVRVYAGLLDQGDIVVTDWSNQLVVHNPPAQPTYFQYANKNLVFYTTEEVSGGDSISTLYVGLNSTQYDYGEVEFTVAYYFTDSNDETVWNVSPLTPAVPNTNIDANLMLLTIPVVGTVSTGVNIYTSVYAVLKFQENNDKFYSVSTVSATAAAPQSPLLDDPILTSINYQVYDSVSTQTMVVNWLAPPNSIIFPVDSYTLQVSTDGGTNWSTVPDAGALTVLTFSVDVSAYSCGKTLTFQVLANRPNNIAISNKMSKSIFKYSTAVQNLLVSDVSASVSGSSSLVSMKITFNNPVDEGCGTPTQYYLNINNGQYTNTYNYVTGQFTITLTNISGVDLTGTITVLLRTQDTNSTDLEDGAPATTSYIASPLTLQPVVYQVYEAPNTSQNMDLSWNSIGLGSGWTLNEYVVVVSNGSVTDTINVGTATSYTYLNQYPCGNTLTFTIKAYMQNGSLNYTVTSNSEQINVYKYASAPQSPIINWSVTDSVTPLTMDVNFQFNNSSTIGCGNAVEYKIELYNNSDPSSPIASATKTYDATTSPYIVNFNDVTYAASIYIKVYLITTDTNGGANKNGAIATASAFTDSLPIYLNVNLISTLLKFDIVSRGALAPVAGIFYPNLNNGTLIYLQWKTNPTTPEAGITISDNIQPNGEHVYSVTMLPEALGSTVTEFPSVFGIVSANTAGIGELPLPLPV